MKKTKIVIPLPRISEDDKLCNYCCKPLKFTLNYGGKYCNETCFRDDSISKYN